MLLKNLGNEIVSSLKDGEMRSTLASALLSQDKTQVSRKDETDYWDFKERQDLQDPFAIADFAKDVLGFFNGKGGALIVGVDKTYRVVGVSPQTTVDSNRLNQKLRSYVSPNVSVFQDVIEIANGKVLWLIFVPKRAGAPVACQKDGPKDNRGRSAIHKNAYYVRVRDEVKACVEPFEFERLFTGASATHQQAYLYEVDEPYYRLLVPHCDVFVGRRVLLDEVKKLLNSRHPIVSLDGVGGVGKSALAIELVKELYSSQKYMFIVSLSAKSKVWVGYTSTRVSGFSGMTEFLRELAAVLCVPADIDASSLKQTVISEMEGLEGLILVDNIEDVDDPAILRFLSLEVPAPVKVLVTSRIDRGLGALTKSIPQMDESEARDLLAQELKALGFAGKDERPGLAQEIVEATGCLPLAIKWAASLAVSSNSLVDASRKIRTTDATKKEFLNFCFKTMFDELSELAKDVATLSPFLGEEWRIPTLSVALDRSEEEIQSAVTELRDRGIILAQTERVDDAMRLLPMTLDFLANKWHESSALSDAVNGRLADAVGSEHSDGLLVNWPYAKRIEVVVRRITELRNTKEYPRALKLIRLAKTWNETIRDPHINFL
jgi:Putative DNA-binding domain/NB-ARC domain